MQEITLPHHFTAQQLHDPNLFSPPIHHDHSSLGSQLDLDPGDPFQFTSQLEQQPHLQHLQSRNPYDQRTPGPSASRFQDIQSSPNRSEQLSNGFNRSSQPGQFGVLTPNHQISNQPQVHHEAIGRLQNEIDLRPVAVQDGGTTEGHFSNMKLVPNPPNLEAWRKRLFDVEGVLTMTEEE